MLVGVSIVNYLGEETRASISARERHSRDQPIKCPKQCNPCPYQCCRNYQSPFHLQVGLQPISSVADCLKAVVKESDATDEPHQRRLVKVTCRSSWIKSRRNRHYGLASASNWSCICKLERDFELRIPMNLSIYYSVSQRVSLWLCEHWEITIL